MTLSLLPDDERQALTRLLSRASHFALVVVDCNMPFDTRRLVNELKLELAAEDRRLRELRLDEPAGDLYARLAEFDPEPSDVLAVIGFEHSFEPGAQVSPALARLNMSREHFRKLPCPLLFFLPEFAVTRMIREAPDFWAWRSGVFVARKPPPGPAAPVVRISADSGLLSLSREQKLSHLEVLRETLGEHEDAGTGSTYEKSDLSLRIAVVLHVLGNVGEAEEAARRAVELAPDGSLEKARASNQLARLLGSRGEVEAALVLHEESLALFEELEDRWECALALGDAARLRFSQGDTEVALELHEERLAVFEEFGDRRERAVTLGDVARIRFSQGDLALALALHEERLAVFEELGDRRERALTLGDIARIRYFQGNVEAALSLYEELLAASEDLGDFGSKVSTLQRLAEIHLQRDEDGKAVQALSESDDVRLSATPAERRFAVGAVLADRYRIVRKLGQGGMGEVYQAHDEMLDVPVALKLVHSRNPQPLKDEVKIARLIADDHVCRLHDIGRHVDGDTEIYFITMEYIEGVPLERLLGIVGALPEEDVFERALELSQGLAAIHDRGVVHRDFKPGNVMIDKDGRARITDFGLAVPAVDAVVTGLVGTLAYMAPEQLDGKAVRESDLYALGLVLYEMLTGCSAFPSLSFLERERRIVVLREIRATQTPSPPSELVPTRSELEKVILRCLEPDSADRYSSAHEVAEALTGKAESPSSRQGPTLRGKDPLHGWLDCVADDHRRLLPFFEGGDQVLLDEVYVEVRLSAQDDARPATEPLEFFGQPISLPELLREVDLRRDKWATGRWLLRGDPGTGKTTLLRHFAAQLARDGGKPWVPFFASLPRWLRESGDLLEQADQRLRRHGFAKGALRRVLTGFAEKGRLLLLLDGLDEVPKEKRGEAASLLSSLKRRWPKVPVVITTRPIGSMLLDGFVDLHLQPFDAGQRQRFLGRWLARTRGDAVPASGQVKDGVVDLEALLGDDPGLRDLAGNPLYLTLMALLVENGDRPARHRTKLYDQVFDLLCKGSYRPEGVALPNRKAAQRVLGFVAYGMTVDNHDNEPLDDIEERLMTPHASDVRQRLAAEERWKRPLEFLEDVGHRTGILGPHDGVNADWRFWHRTFREALAAEELQRRGMPAALKLARKISKDEGRWAEPYALLAGRLKEPDALVVELAKVNHPLCVRALATVQGLKDETLVEVLELSGGWEERRKVYEQIPGLVDDPQRSLALVDRLRCRIRDGNDFFFLERTTVAIGIRHSEASARVEELRERFYDHVPPPPEKLFRKVETCDGLVSLWQLIPAGSFRMGSPEGESLDRERPQHSVTLISDFQMAAIPVTNAQYAAFDPAYEDAERPLYPVVGVTWFAAMAFCRWLATAFPGVRLPTEEEWEYAARAGTTTRYWSGGSEADLARVDWYLRNSGMVRHPTGGKAVNPWGLYDVHGNVREWTLNKYTANYTERAEGVEHHPAVVSADQAAETAGSDRTRVFRGASFRDNAVEARVAIRDARIPGAMHGSLGFRVVLPEPSSLDP